MFPVNTFKKRIIFDFLNSRGSNSMFPFTAESGKDRCLSADLEVFLTLKKISSSLSLFSPERRVRGSRNRTRR